MIVLTHPDREIYNQRYVVTKYLWSVAGRFEFYLYMTKHLHKCGKLELDLQIQGFVVGGRIKGPFAGVRGPRFALSLLMLI